MKTHYNLCTQIKVRICCVIALIAATQSLYAWDYLTVYRNDGEEPLVLFLADIDSMVCSKIGTDSLLYADWQVQEIWAPDTTYRIPLASIDSIKINAVDPEEANKNLVEASKGVSKIFLQTENISELASHLDEIRNMEKVEKAWVNGTSLLVKVKDWGTISFSFPISYEASSEKENGKSIHKDIKKATTNPSDTHSPLYDDQSLYDICIVNQAYNDENRSNVGRDANQMKDNFNSCGFRYVRPVNGEEFNLGFLENEIYNYDIILMATHGVFDGQHHWIYTGQKFNVFKTFKEIDEWSIEVPNWVIDKQNSINNNLSPGCVSCGFLKEKRDGVDVLVLYAKVSESFFAKNKKRFKGDGRSLFFNTACQSMQENRSLPRALLRKGLGYYLGYTHTNSVGWKACKEFTELILNGYDFVDAKQNHMSFENKYEQIQEPDQQGEIETVVSELVGSQYYTLENVHTCIIKPETLETESPFNGKLYGKITQLNPSKTVFTYGFCISEDKEMKSSKVLDGISFNQCSYDSSSHTVSFNIELDDYDKMKVGKYYYCAYICDGKNYCFGDIICREPYTVWDEVNKTDTLYYDGKREMRGGKDFSDSGKPILSDYCEKVVFDSLFVNYYPESTAFWFYGCENLKTIENIQYLNTSNVTNMSHMFADCKSLTSLDLSSFNTANVTNMRYMFAYCESLESLDLSSFNAANVTDMGNMFSLCESLKSLDLSSFNTANVTDMGDMFAYCKSLESLDLSSFNTANVTNMRDMFAYCKSLESLDLSSFNTANVTDMYGMFSGCSSLTTLDLSSFNTANVTNMRDMFAYCKSLESLDLSSFNTANVTDMNRMFAYCKSLTSLDLSSFNTANVTDMWAMFDECSYLTSLDLSSFNTANVTDMGYMFYECSYLTSLDLSSFNTANVTDMGNMFSLCESLKSLDLSSFNTANVTDMNWMFAYCKSLKTIYAGNWKKISNDDDMFWGCNNLVGGKGTKIGSNYYEEEGCSLYYYCDYDSSVAHIDGGEDRPGLFTAK